MMTPEETRLENERLRAELAEQLRPSNLVRSLRRPETLLAVARAAMPLVGVVLLGWSAVEVLAYYFLETIVVGAFNVPKLFASPGGDQGSALALSLFFIVHYGMFVGIQAVFVFGATGVADEALALFGDPEGMLAVVAVVGWEAADHLKWLRGVRPRRDVQMFMPYPRIVVQQFVAIIGGWGVLFLRGTAAATWSLIVLVLVRFAVDGLFAPVFSEALRRVGSIHPEPRTLDDGQ